MLPLQETSVRAYTEHYPPAAHLKVIQIPFCFHPDPVAGTEVFVESLARHLNQWDIEAVIAAPGESSAHYQHQGLAVRRFAVSGEIDDLRELYGEGDLNAAREFARILDEEQPDLIHLHAFTSGASIRLVREAKRCGIKVAFTYHTPTVSCQRGTLMRWGSEICDGRLNLHTCAACTLNSLGVGRMGSQVSGRMPRVVGRLAGSVGLSGGVWTAVSFLGHRPGDFTVSEEFSRHCLSLPIYPELTDLQIQSVANALREAVVK